MNNKSLLRMFTGVSVAVQHLAIAHSLRLGKESDSGISVGLLIVCETSLVASYWAKDESKVERITLAILILSCLAYFFSQLGDSFRAVILASLIAPTMIVKLSALKESIRPVFQTISVVGVVYIAVVLFSG